MWLGILFLALLYVNQVINKSWAQLFCFQFMKACKYVSLYYLLFCLTIGSGIEDYEQSLLYTKKVVQSTLKIRDKYKVLNTYYQFW